MLKPEYCHSTIYMTHIYRHTGSRAVWADDTLRLGTEDPTFHPLSSSVLSIWHMRPLKATLFSVSFMSVMNSNYLVFVFKYIHNEVRIPQT